MWNRYVGDINNYMNDNHFSLDFENIFHDDGDTLVLESSKPLSNANLSEDNVNVPTPDDLASGIWMS